ncbi:MAG TPA: hypothetical protein VF591_05625 [Pyrinomonadaceae bacterium]|jgi:hypothetical protein
MRSKLSAVALVLLCLAAPARADVDDSPGVARAAAQDGKSRLIVPMQSGAFVVIRTETSPPSATGGTSDLVESEDKPNLLRRVFVDSGDEMFFGYELLVERAAESRYFWVTVRALGEDYLRELRERPAFRGRRLHPGYNATAFPASPQFLRDGDTFALDVFQNPRTGTKIVDVIQVSLTDPSLRQADDKPRDFSPEGMHLKVSDYKLKVNGETVYRSTGGCAGAVIWFSLGDRGRFVFSLVERPGFPFRKVGAVRNNTVAFEWGGDKYEWESSLPVVGTGGSWNLWVLHDPDYRVDLFEQAPAPAAAEGDKTLAQKAAEAERRLKQRGAQAEYGAPSAHETQTPRRTRRTRVVIGSADGVEHLFPRQPK